MNDKDKKDIIDMVEKNKELEKFFNIAKGKYRFSIEVKYEHYYNLTKIKDGKYDVSLYAKGPNDFLCPTPDMVFFSDTEDVKKYVLKSIEKEMEYVKEHGMKSGFKQSLRDLIKIAKNININKDTPELVLAKRKLIELLQEDEKHAREEVEEEYKRKLEEIEKQKTKKVEDRDYGSFR